MFRRKNYFLLFSVMLVLCLLFAGQSFAQDDDKDFGKILNLLTGDAAEGYVAPMMSGLASSFNGGWFRKAPPANKFSLDIEFGIAATGSFLESSALTFRRTADFELDADLAREIVLESLPPSHPLFDDIVNELTSQVQTMEIFGPTIIGSESDEIMITYSGATILGETIGAHTLNLKDATGVIEDPPLIPFAAPQLRIGTIYGTRATFRYFPNIDASDKIGSFEYFGFGVTHNPQVWFPDRALPINISFGFFTQALNLGFETESDRGTKQPGEIDIDGFAYGISASKRLGKGPFALTPYAGLMIEESSIKVDYSGELEKPDGSYTDFDVDLKFDGDNTTRLVVGFSAQILLLNLSVDYNFAATNSASIGLMFGF